MLKGFLGLAYVLCLAGYEVIAQSCIKPKEPKLFVDGRELPVTDFKTYTLNLCTGQTKKLTFEAQGSDYKYFIGKQTGERLLDNKIFTAGTPASVDVAFDNAVAGTYLVYILSGADTDGTTAPACSSEPLNLVIEKSFFGPKLDLNYTGSRDTCLNSVLQIKATGSQGSILWTKNGIPDGTTDTYTFTLTTATEISATLLSAESCALPKTAGPATINFTVSPPQTPSVTIKRSDPTVQNCEGESVFFQKLTEQNQGNFPTYQWFVNGIPQPGKTDPMDFMLENWTNGTKVQLELSRNDGCTSQSNVLSNAIDLTGKPKNPAPVNILEIRNSAGTNVVCKGTKVTLAPVTNTKGLEYVWTGPGLFYPDSVYSPTIDQTAFYKVSAFLSGCATGSDTDSIEIKVADDMQVSIKEKLVNSTEFSVCQGDSVKFTAVSNRAGSSFVWFRNNQVVGNDSIIHFRSLLLDDVIKVQAVSSCTGNASDSLKIKIDGPGTGFSNGTGPVDYCGQSGVLLSPNETNTIYTYKWYKDGNPLDIGTQTYTATQPGLYQVNIGTASCSSLSSIEVREQTLSATMSAQPAQFVPGDDVALSAVVDNPSGELLTFKWEPENIIAQPDLQNTIARPSETTTFKLTVKAGDNCTYTNFITVTKIDTTLVDTTVINPIDTTVVLPYPSPDPVSQLFIPNALTPSAVDQNAYWGISGTELYPEIEIKVFNRWGSTVFDSKGYSKPWDGTINGKELPSGTYYYLIQDKSFARPMMGALTIFR